MKIKTIKMNISGMTCSGCESTVSRLLSADGVEAKVVNYRERNAEVSYDEDVLSPEDLAGLVNQSGHYKVTGVEGETPASSSEKHMIIIGGGSAAFGAALEAQSLGARVTLINAGLPIGGTCVNVGCVPSKNLIRAAETLHKAESNPFNGIQTGGRVTDFKALINQKRQLVNELQEQKYVDVIADVDGIQQIPGRAKVTSSKSVEVNGKTIAGDALLIATGARPNIPNIEGLDDVNYLTNESAFELDALPKSLIVLGGRFIALEIAQMFSRLGSEVTILQRSERILPDEDSDLTDPLTGYLEDEGLRVVTSNQFQRITESENGIAVETRVNGELRTFTAEHLLVATGRTPNTDNMGLEDIGVELKSDAGIIVDGTLKTSIDSIYAVGDVLNKNMFVYTAAYEGKLAARNAILGESNETDYSVLPWVIFTDPQVVGVGLDERQALAAGINAESSVLPMEYVPRALAARDTRGFVKLIRDADTDLLVGARILAPEGSELIMEIATAMNYGVTVQGIIDMFHPYLTNSEAIKLAANHLREGCERVELLCNIIFISKCVLDAHLCATNLAFCMHNNTIT